MGGVPARGLGLLPPALGSYQAAPNRHRGGTTCRVVHYLKHATKPTFENRLHFRDFTSMKTAAVSARGNGVQVAASIRDIAVARSNDEFVSRHIGIRL